MYVCIINVSVRKEVNILEGKSALTINLPVSYKQSLKKQAETQGVTMTELICNWIVENDKNLQK